MNPTRLNDARSYSLNIPGKRLRPQLLEASARATGNDRAEALAGPSAEAIELIHTYSLIHDDLPAMDDDDLRRGRPTLHVAFDEATAILVGDGLQAKAFELIANDDELSTEQRVRLIARLAKAAGFDGMVGGQGLDIEATNKDLSLDDLKNIHALKTGALITAALVMGGIVGNATDAQLATLETVGEKIGLAFQIIDDVIDVRSDSSTLGKTAGKDAAAGKTTYVALMGVETAQTLAMELYDEALALIADWDSSADSLRALLGKMVKRDR
ncbi:polyprenyl synthetase family protein [Congregibacter litoralis]|uniref:Farnesyl-diphosphate synthase n=1 Tax=Congregibacter litoralis KT71 TaxID=314285 RepID=A4A6D7_9GAMM|nr:farnesyl diphosphate synthase [Congregibacter litoralis]EAQ98584.1 farnesyl-diphosphate synthase [Congregibacter litoralis KT71]